MTRRDPGKINGGWSAWDTLSACSRTCGGGVRVKRRYCNNPEYVNFSQVIIVYKSLAFRNLKFQHNQIIQDISLIEKVIRSKCNT